MKEELRFGVIGLDSSVEYFLSACYQNKMECKAICTSNKKMAKQLADEFYIDAVVSNVDDLLEREDIDFVYIASNDYRLVLNCIANHKNVICEGQCKQADKIVNIAAEYKVLVLNNFLDGVRITEESGYEVEDALYNATKEVKRIYEQQDFETCYQLLREKKPSVARTTSALAFQ